MLKTIVIFLIIFSIMVVFHELGHLYWAKKAGILVREFSLGMGPKLFAKQAQDGTTYTIRMLPMGGYVRLAGLGEEEQIQPGQSLGLLLDDQDQVVRINLSNKSYDLAELPVRVDQVDLVDEMTLTAYEANQEVAKTFKVSRQAEIIEEDGTILKVAPIETRYESVSVWRKMLTNFGGPLNNFILSIVAFAIVGFMLPGVPTYSNQIDVLEDTPAAQAGLEQGDRILAVNGQEVKDWNQLIAALDAVDQDQTDLTIDRQGQTFTKQVAFKEIEEGQRQIGITMQRSTAIVDRLLFGFIATWNVITMVLSVLASIFTRGFDLNLFGGPVAMAQATSTVANQGLMNIIWFMASLSANLGIVNLIPIPALDGGKIVLNLIELVRGKPLSQEKEGIITLVGVVLLLILMVAVTWNDIMRAFT